MYIVIVYMKIHLTIFFVFGRKILKSSQKGKNKKISMK